MTIHRLCRKIVTKNNLDYTLFFSIDNLRNDVNLLVRDSSLDCRAMTCKIATRWKCKLDNMIYGWTIVNRRYCLSCTCI